MVVVFFLFLIYPRICGVTGKKSCRTRNLPVYLAFQVSFQLDEEVIQEPEVTMRGRCTECGAGGRRRMHRKMPVEF